MCVFCSVFHNKCNFLGQDSIIGPHTV